MAWIEWDDHVEGLVLPSVVELLRRIDAVAAVFDEPKAISQILARTWGPRKVKLLRKLVAQHQTES